ncbi:unnamed protein product [Brachionus calyciflorus]|uniref:PID domain-containing protein n=1 Tax=Brachionus calyciflorus TaxID=104777 RepID=A0A814F9Y3_9BILA|nr:unnamed protein product [Brachionus calyciflorus]
MSSPAENEIPLTPKEPELKPVKNKRQMSIQPNDPERFKYGVLIRGKFIGVEDVKKENGDDICQTAMIKLKAVVLAKKEHKQRICVKIDLDGIEIQDEKTNQTMFKHSVNRISYIARDSTDARAIGYIYKNSPNNFQYFAIKTEKAAQELFNTLKDLFEVVLEMRNAEKKDAEKTEKSEKPEPVQEEKANENLKKTETITQMNNVVEQMNKQQANLLDLPGDDLQHSSIENSLDTPVSPPVSSQPPSNELFSVFDAPSSNPTPPVSQNDKYNSLLNDLSSLSTSPQPRAVPQLPPLPSAQLNNPFGQTNSSPFFQPQPAVPNYSNPFGTFNSAPVQPVLANPMMGANSGFQSQQPQQPPRPAPIPNQMMFQNQQTNLFPNPLSAPMPMNNMLNTNTNQQQNNNSFPW